MFKYILMIQNFTFFLMINHISINNKLYTCCEFNIELNFTKNEFVFNLNINACILCSFLLL